MQLQYTTEEIMADHPFAMPNEFEGGKLHGGYDDEGRYISPRTLNRWPAIKAWRQTFLDQGGELIDSSTELLGPGNYPNHAQMKLLLQNGVSEPLWNTLTTTGIIEGRGKMLASIVAPDFQPLVEQDISNTTTAHLNKGLFRAHGLDEGGSDDSDVGAHDQMWFVARDLVLGKDAHPIPTIPDRGGRPGADGREASALPQMFEMLVKQMMNVLLIEIRAERGFTFSVNIMRDPDLFQDRRELAEQAADIVDQIRQDEASHVGYLQLFISELRSFTFKGESGPVSGKDIIDPLWERIVSFGVEVSPVAQREASQQYLHGLLAAKPDGDALIKEFDRLADS